MSRHFYVVIGRLKNNMGVGPSDTERIDANPLRAVARPWNGIQSYLEIPLYQRNIRMRGVEIDIGGDGSVFQHEGWILECC